MALSRNQIIGAASSVYLIPNFVLTVVPTFARDPGMAVCMAFGVIALPFIPFALRQCKDAVALMMVAILGVIVLLYNFSNALDALNRIHAIETGDARGHMANADYFNDRIKELGERRKGIQKDAGESVEAAQKAREKECSSGLGPVCRERETALLNAQRDRTDHLERVDADIDAMKAGLAKLGAVEKSADPTASQIAGIAGLFWASVASQGDAISTNRPVFKASVVEFMGGLMPWIMVMIFGKTAPSPKLRSRKPAKNDASKDSVLAWHTDRIEKRPGRKGIRAGVAFADYETWCAAHKLAAVNFSNFGVVMKDELGVKKDTTNSRVTYIGIGFKTQLKVVA